MKVYKRMILSYIDKYMDLNFDILSRELQIPVICLVGILDELLSNGYIITVNGKYIITDKGKLEKYNSWNEISIYKDESIREVFQWEDLYIPNNFLKNL